MCVRDNVIGSLFLLIFDWILGLYWLYLIFCLFILLYTNNKININ